MPPLTQEQTQAIETANKNAKVTTDMLTGSTVTPTLPVTTPPAAPAPAPFDINQYITPTQGTDITALENDTSSIFEQLMGANKATETRGRNVTRLEEQSGIPKLTTDLAEIQNQINQKDLAFRREREGIQLEAGLTAAQKNARLSDVSRKQSSELADLEVVRAARSNSLNAIQSIIDRKVSREFADEDARIKNLQFVYDNVKSDLTKAQDRKYQEMIARENRGFELAKGKYEQVENTKGQMVKNAALLGADSSTIAKIMSITDEKTLYSTPGFSKYLVSPLEKLQYEKASFDSKQMKKIMEESGIDNNLTPAQKEDILKNKNAQQAASRIGVIRAIQKYSDAYQDWLKNGESRSGKKALDAMLNTTVGSAINVAQGQGALGNEEAERVLGNLKVRFIQNQNIIPAAAAAIIDAQDRLTQNDISFVEAAIPGASTGYQFFADYNRSKTDPLMVNDQENPANNPLKLNLD